MSYSVGTLSISAGTNGTFEAPNEGVKAIIIGNNSGLNVKITMESGGVQKTLYPGTLDWFPVNRGFTGNILISPSSLLNNTSSWPSNILSFDAIGVNDPENANMYPVTLSQPAVNPTASGNPIFSATIGFGSTASKYQALNIANPANSGVIMTFHSARAFTNDSTIPACNLLLKVGADLNLGTAVTIVSHDGKSSPPVSVGHATAEDQVVSHGATSTIEVMDMNNATETQDFLEFPDNYTLEPGNNLYMQLTSGTTGHVVRLTFKWSESPVQTSATLPGVNMTILTASTLVNDGNTANTGIIESTPSGQSSSANYATNDGQWLLNVLQSGVYHQFLKTQTSGDPLQLGQAGDLIDILGGLNLAGISVVSNGSTAGTATLVQLLSGTIKAVCIIFNGFKNGGSAITAALPTAFSTTALIFTTLTNGVNFSLSNSQQSINIVTGLPSTGAASSGGSVTAQAGGGNGIGKWSIGAVGAFDSVVYTSGNGSTVTGLMFIIGS